VASLLSPITETTRGLKGYARGIRWLKSHPRYMVLLFIPMVLALLIMTVGWGLFFKYQDVFFGWVLFDRPESWWLLSIFYICKALLYVALIAVGFISIILCANILACPVYELVSVAIERDLSGGYVEEVSLWESLKLMGEEIKKVSFILTVSLILLVIPGVNLIATFVTAFLVGWDFYDYPMARRGWTFRMRLNFVLKDFWAVMGLGLWLMIPLVQIVLVPMAVAGGTILSLESLAGQKRRIKG